MPQSNEEIDGNHLPNRLKPKWIQHYETTPQAPPQKPHPADEGLSEKGDTGTSLGSAETEEKHEALIDSLQTQTKRTPKKSAPAKGEKGSRSPSRGSKRSGGSTEPKHKHKKSKRHHGKHKKKGSDDDDDESPDPRPPNQDEDTETNMLEKKALNEPKITDDNTRPFAWDLNESIRIACRKEAMARRQREGTLLDSPLPEELPDIEEEEMPQTPATEGATAQDAVIPPAAETETEVIVNISTEAASSAITAMDDGTEETQNKEQGTAEATSSTVTALDGAVTEEQHTKQPTALTREQQVAADHELFTRLEKIMVGALTLPLYETYEEEACIWTNHEASKEILHMHSTPRIIFTASSLPPRTNHPIDEWEAKLKVWTQKLSFTSVRLYESREMARLAARCQLQDF
ncbi:MAG: hypothetical protein GY740_07555, partial [Gammaproteobacteria bacterium]|nr:hypothetical protein [Gammaproteobacteria bacterium]